ncbi:TonB-linked outer membrane protein, SusC/RagA family [Tangfeifania diversioriginum]|uniref:TonB-linked outer membrane protein, SusC/RagA family n=1 Tax=Tangfeifania diversioriginum TaxID=1168035 RepID=A0A1M6A9Z8_9BACT|nr:SusC/RagA family TonB-linked outer membrane protein [Tangfeifania diversioriginum]SHI33278.1 TonB-linked outer membrane protein, SusC/RagA family [Tangfeifania diversioriginum]
MKKLSFLFLLIFSVTSLMAQQTVVVTGKVTDESDLGLPGVTILEKGTQNGTITNFDGDYSIEVPPDATLSFSFVGFITKEVSVDGSTTIDVELKEDIIGLEEVVVVGYGELKVKDLTSSISTIESAELVKTPSGQAMQGLQGKVAGVQVVSAGSPGAEPTVRIRGVGSFPTSSNSSPLYVVDGMYFDNIDFLNPSDIETLSVLKDASASAIYGVRAANGVVLITTKDGSLNTETTITYEGYIGMQVPQNVLQMANSEQFVNYINQVGDPADISFIQNAMQRYGRSRINPNVPNVNTDWYAEIMKPYAQQQNHSLSILGGTEKTSYSIGISYFDQEGLLETENSFTRLNLRTKIDHQANNWLKAGVNFNVSNGTRYIANDAAWFSAYHAVPILPVYDDQNYEQLVNNETPNPSRYSSAQLIGYRGSQNPFLSLDFNEDRQDIRKALSGIYTEVDILQDKLKFKTNYNVSLTFIKGRNVGIPYYITNSTNRPLSTISSSRTTIVNQFLDNTLTYTDSFGDHNLTAMAGTSYRDEWYDYLSGYAEDIPLNENSWYIGQSRAQ